jgi:AraC-like DNA-binding protein
MDMNNHSRYNLDKGWRFLFKEMNISSEEVLRHAQLPSDLLIQKSPTVTAEQYFDFWEGITKVSENDPTFIIRLVQAINSETLSPALFACLSSQNLNMAFHRISYYKPIEGPIRLEISETTKSTSVIFHSVNEGKLFPPALACFELAFWVRLARLATREEIVPMKVESNVKFKNQIENELFFKTKIVQDKLLRLTFSAADSKKPFVTTNEAIWSIIEPALNKRMKDLDQKATFAERVRSCLVEMLPSGRYSVESIANKLGLSTRTLQRRLREENLIFQNILDHIRESISKNYIRKSNYSNAEIGFLIGYEETNSFFRAFKSWTGQTPEEYRESITSD